MKTIYATIAFYLIFTPISFAQLFNDNLSAEKIGDFPSQWDLLQGSAQINVLNGEKAIELGNNAIIAPYQQLNYPEEVVIEFDLYFTQANRNTGYQYYKVRLWEGTSSGKVETDQGQYYPWPFRVFRHGVAHEMVSNLNGRRNKQEFNHYSDDLNDKEPTWRQVRFEYTPSILKVFLNNDLILNMPRPKFKPTAFSIEGYSNQGVADVNAVKNIRIGTMGARPTPDLSPSDRIVEGQTPDFMPNDSQNAKPIPDFVPDDSNDAEPTPSFVPDNPLKNSTTPEFIPSEQPPMILSDSINTIDPTKDDSNKEAIDNPSVLTNPDPVNRDDIILEKPEEPVFTQQPINQTLDNVSFLNPISEQIIHQYVQEELIRLNIPGLALGFYQEGILDFAQGYGYQDVDRTKPITEKTIMRWASISKTLTAVALLQAIEKGKISSLDEKVHEIVPYYTNNTFYGPVNNLGLKEVPDLSKKKDITIRHLVTNCSGIKQYEEDLDKAFYTSDTDKFNAKSCVNLFKWGSLEFTPGSDYKYSTQGFNLLGAVIDEATGSYPQWVKNNVMEPLNMTSLRIADGNFWGVAKPRDGIVVNKKVDSREFVLPGGGWESDIRDLLEFGKGIIDNQLLNSPSELWSTKDFDALGNYRRGVMRLGSGDDLIVYHNGTHDNMKTSLYVLPNRKIVIATLIPAEYADRPSSGGDRGEEFNLADRLLDYIGLSNNRFTLGPYNKCNRKMGSSDKKFFGVWQDKGAEDVIFRRGYNKENFEHEWKTLAAAGYYLHDIDYSDFGWNGLFKKGNLQMYMWRDRNSSEFQDKYQEMKAKGYSLYDLEVYPNFVPVRLYAGLFKKQNNINLYKSNLTTKEMGDEHVSKINAGYRIIDIEPYLEGSTVKWAGVWEKGEQNLMNRNMSLEEFKAKYNEYYANYQLLDIEIYKDSQGNQKWAAIWTKRITGDRINSSGDVWCDFLQKNETHNTMVHNGALIDIESFDE